MDSARLRQSAQRAELNRRAVQKPNLYNIAKLSQRALYAKLNRTAVQKSEPNLAQL